MTLLELILVLVIISTVLALASPSLRGFFGGRQADDLARQLVALTQWARSLAVAQGRPYRLNLDPRDGAFWLTVQEGGSFQELSVECGRRFLVPEGVQAAWEEPSDAASHGYVTFYPDGRSDVAVILLTGRQGQKLEVRCRSATEGWEAVQAEETGG